MVIRDDKKKTWASKSSMHVRSWDKQMFLLPTQQAEVKGKLVSFGELLARRDKVKTHRCTPAAKIWGDEYLDAFQRTSLLEPRKNSRSVSDHLFLTRICCFTLSSFLSYADFLAFVNFYNSRVTTRSKFSLLPQRYKGMLGIILW